MIVSGKFCKPFWLLKARFSQQLSGDFEWSFTAVFCPGVKTDKNRGHTIVFGQAGGQTSIE